MNTVEITEGPPRIAIMHGCLACGASCEGRPPFVVELGVQGSIHVDICAACAFSHRTPEALQEAIYRHLPAITAQIHRMNKISANGSRGRA
jgi:hypothetical protein